VSRTHPNLVGHWRFEDNLLDASGNGNNGTVGAGSAAYAAGKIGQGWNADGNTFIITGISQAIGGAFTMMAWVKVVAEDETVVSYEETSGRINSYIQLRANNQIRFRIRFGSLLNVTYPAGVSVGQWAHVALTYDGTSGAAYINGKHVGSVPVGAETGTEIFVIGRLSANFDRKLQTVADDVRIYNAALLPVDIRHIKIQTEAQRRYA
jgi:hypothetical protein